MKRILYGLATVVFVVILSTIQVFAVDIIDSGYCGGEGDGTNLTWSVTNTGELVISGNGAMKEFAPGGTSQYPWSSYRTDICSIKIESGVTSIGAFVFDYLSNVTSVSIADTVTTIGINAFASDELRSITVPASVSNISNYAFECANLSVIVFEGNAPAFATEAFYGRSLIAYYPMDDNTWVETVKESFGGHIIWTESGSEWTDVSGYYGADDDRKNISWELDQNGTLTIFGNGKMYSSQYLGHGPWYAYRALIKSAVVEDGVENIGSCAFSGCYNINSLVLPESVTNIDFCAFSDCVALKEVELPSSLLELGYAAFMRCTSLKEIVLPDGITTGTLEGTFSGCSALETVNIPEGVTELNSTFRHCSSLKTIALPESLVKLSQTFSGCSSLETIDIPASVSDISGAFEGCSSLTSVVVPQGVACIDAATFLGCTNLALIILPPTVEELGMEAFSGNPTLRFIDIPSSVSVIHGNAFVDCTGLSTVRFEGNAPDIPEAQWGIEVFVNVTATAFYPSGNETWTAEKMQAFGGNIEWVAYIDCTEHTWGNSSCAEPHWCSDCGYIETSPSGHSYTAYKPDNNATCENDGTETAFCDNGCGEFDTRIINGSATGHSYTSYIFNNDATCEANGTETSECEFGCGTTSTRTAENSMLNHDEINHEAKAPTYTEVGWNAYVTCSRCDYTTYKELPKVEVVQKPLLGRFSLEVVKSIIVNGERVDICRWVWTPLEEE